MHIIKLNDIKLYVDYNFNYWRNLYVWKMTEKKKYLNMKNSYYCSRNISDCFFASILFSLFFNFFLTMNMYHFLLRKKMKGTKIISFKQTYYDDWLAGLFVYRLECCYLSLKKKKYYPFMNFKKVTYSWGYFLNKN